MANSHSAAELATQKDRLLRISTVLDSIERASPGDPLLLVKFDAEEGISVPYQYDVIMYRSAVKNQARPIKADMLVGTKAIIHARGEDEGCAKLQLKLTRQGIFLTFEQLESEQPDEYVRFAARLVPPFRLLEFESGFRVFEQTSVLDILKQVLVTGTTIPINTLDFGALDKAQQDRPNIFPLLEYCVQFGESTFNFASRLMAEYGIWYYFGQNETDRNPNSTIIHNELMIFGHGPLIPTDSRSESLAHMRITNDAPTFPVDQALLDLGSSVGWTISSWRRTFAPPPFLQLDGGNFNQLKPDDPIDASDRVPPSYSTFTVTNPPAYDPARVLRQTFPTPTESNDRRASKTKAKEYEDAAGYVDTRISEAEAKVSVVSGISKNPTFIPGTLFRVDTDLTKREPIPDRSFMAFALRWVKTSAFDLHYDFIPAFSILADVWNKSTSQFKAIDATMSTVAQGLQEWMQNYVEGQIDFDASQLLHLDSKFYLYNLAGGLSYALTSSLATAGSQLLHDLLDDRSGFSNSFICVDTADHVPLPAGIKPKADGPHLALVIGPNQDDELNTDQGDIFADQVGRVRVRFPWDKQRFLLRPDIAGAVTRPAAWVRFSEGWAGRRFGAQFLPRIGEEVIVNFINGDPDRPIITGRVYNADHGFANLPFPNRLRAKQDVTLDDWLTPVGSPEFRFSGIKTDSMPTNKSDGKPDEPRFHLLRFNDTRGGEQYLIRSQWRMDVTTLGSYFDSTHWFRHMTIGHFDEHTRKCFGDYRTKVFNELDLHIGDPRDPQSGSAHILAEGSYGLHVKKGTNLALDGGCSISSGRRATASINAGTIVISATSNITLSVGGSSVVITPGRVNISPPNDLSLAGLTMPVVPASVHEPHDPVPADSGDVLKLVDELPQ